MGAIADTTKVMRIGMLFLATVDWWKPSLTRRKHDKRMTNDWATIAVFDPGVTTGYCYAKVRYVKSKPTLPVIMETTEILWPDRFIHLEQIFNRMDKHTIDALIVEDFYLYPHMARTKIGSRFDEIRMIGAIQTYAAQHGLMDVWLWQSATQAKSIKKFPDEWKPLPKGEHMKDTLRHLRYWYLMRSKGKIPDGRHWNLMKG